MCQNDMIYYYDFADFVRLKRKLIIMRFHISLKWRNIVSIPKKMYWLFEFSYSSIF